MYARNASFSPPAGSKADSLQDQFPITLLTIVRNVLALRIDSIDLQPVFRDSVIAVLVDDALRVVPEVEIGLVVPPVFVVAVLVELPAPVIEAVCDLVSDHEADGSKVQIAAKSVRQELTGLWIKMQQSHTWVGLC